MNRHRSSIKLVNNNKETKILSFDQDFDSQPDEQNIIQSNIKNNTLAHLQEQPQVDNQIRLKSIVSDDMKLVDDDQEKLESVKVNNFFGSKKILQRKLEQALEQQYNPQTRQRRQLINIEDPNEKLQKLVQQQISQRQQWQRQSYTKDIQQQYNINNEQTLSQKGSPLLIISDVQSFQRMTSKQKLTKINQEKYAAINIQKNTLFGMDNDNDDDEYIMMSPVVTTQCGDVVQQIEEKKKNSLPQLRQLKKKLSTYEVLNQLDLIKKVDSPLVGKLILIENHTKEQLSTPLTQFTSTRQSKPTPRKTLNLSKTRIIGLDIKNFLQFTTSPIPKGKYIEGMLYRDRTGVDNTFFPQYSLLLDDVSVVMAKKTMKGYEIFVKDQRTGERRQVGSVKGNVLGSCYNLYENDQETEIIATICYDSSITTKAVAREVELYVKTSAQNNSLDYSSTSSRQATTDLKTLHTIDNSQTKKYINLQPILDTDTNIYTLNFGGKVTMASVKNVILVDDQNHKDKKIIFGKCGWDSFYLKVQNGLSPLVVMGYLMTSFNFKWVTQ